MGVSQVYYGEQELIDLADDTVTPETLLEGMTAHNAAGERIVGTLPGGGGSAGVASFNGRSGSVMPMSGDYKDDLVTLSSEMHIGGGTQNTVKGALEALDGKTVMIPINPSPIPTDNGAIWITT